MYTMEINVLTSFCSNVNQNYCQEQPPQPSSRWTTSSCQLLAIQENSVRGILQSRRDVGGPQKNEFSEKASVMENPEKNKVNA